MGLEQRAGALLGHTSGEKTSASRAHTKLCGVAQIANATLRERASGRRVVAVLSLSLSRKGATRETGENVVVDGAEERVHEGGAREREREHPVTAGGVEGGRQGSRHGDL